VCFVGQTEAGGEGGLQRQWRGRSNPGWTLEFVRCVLRLCAGVWAAEVAGRTTARQIRPGDIVKEATTSTRSQVTCWQHLTAEVPCVCIPGTP